MSEVPLYSVFSHTGMRGQACRVEKEIKTKIFAPLEKAKKDLQ